jgi:hypothetical protein
MDTNAIAFEHDAHFEAGEVSGHLRLGKFEAHYEELFAEVIEDGVITTEERQRLDKAADALGLDRSRLQKLEQALQAAYEARHQIKIQDLSLEEVPRASLRLPPSEQSTEALRQRVAFLEARVRDLEKELETARSTAAVEVDLSDFSATTSQTSDDPDELHRILRQNPHDVDALHKLFKYYQNNEQPDNAWCCSHVLSFLEVATAQEQEVYLTHRLSGLIQPKSSISQDSWRRLLFHPEQEVLTGEIFAVIVSAVLLGRVSAMRRDKTLPVLDPATKQDVKQSTLQSVRCFSWASSLLGMPTPTLFADPSYAGGVEMVPGIPPVSRLGKQALSGRTAWELAFLAGRHLSWYREEHFVRMLVPSIPDLEHLFLAALLIANPSVPINPTMQAQVVPLAKAIQPVLEPLQVDRLRGYFLRFLEEGGRTNLQRWANSADFTASRAGLLLCNDLSAAKSMLELEDREHFKTRMLDLLSFVSSTRYFQLRKQLGIAIQTTPLFLHFSIYDHQKNDPRLRSPTNFGTKTLRQTAACLGGIA